MPQVKRKVHFDDYKAIKDEIIEISEQRFENILTKRLRDFKIEIMGDIDKRIDGINKRFEDINKRFEDINRRFEDFKDDVNKRFTIMFWILGLFITIYIATYSILLNIIINK